MPKQDDELAKEWRKLFAPVEQIALHFLKQWAGDRCSDFEPTCGCCKMWAAWDTFKKETSLEQ